jgi:hypothetical protein
MNDRFPFLVALLVVIAILAMYSLRSTHAHGPEPHKEPPDRYQVELAKVRTIVPSDAFFAVIEEPFVVVGDGGQEAVESFAASTVRWSVKHLKQLYFEKDPDKVITVWLFKDGDSYRKHAKLLFDDEPDTPYGYYSPSHKALVMNIATGGGTLVHEIVHPFVRANFPDCPDWLNEGLGSLYEQSSQRDGRIIGLTNWRLAGLQEAISSGSVPTFEHLIVENRDGFYDNDPGTNYGQARYLCYYLQEKGKLTQFYHAFFKAKGADPTGIKTLRRILETDDLVAFQKQWEQWIMKLTFP